jgi:hypothetical protein
VSRWPDDPRRFAPSVGWFGVIAVVIVAGIFGFIGVWMWAAYHHNTLVSELTGDWAQSSADVHAYLLIRAETKAVHVNRDESCTYTTGALLVTGQIDGRLVTGRIVLHSFPPWSSTAHMTLLGEGWTLSFTDLPGGLTATSDSGRVMKLLRP